MSREDRCDVCGNSIMYHAMGSPNHEYVNVDEVREDSNYVRQQQRKKSYVLQRRFSTMPLAHTKLSPWR